MAALASLIVAYGRGLFGYFEGGFRTAMEPPSSPRSAQSSSWPQDSPPPPRSSTPAVTERGDNIDVTLAVGGTAIEREPGHEAVKR